MVTVGINYSQMHDSSACIVRDGELLFAVAEERLSRVKHDAGFPQLAIQACLQFAGVGAEQLDEVCFGWQTAGPVYRHDLKLYATRGVASYLSERTEFDAAFCQHVASKIRSEAIRAAVSAEVEARMRFVDHHLAHAISAYAYSGI